MTNTQTVLLIDGEIAYEDRWGQEVDADTDHTI